MGQRHKKLGHFWLLLEVYHVTPASANQNPRRSGSRAGPIDVSSVMVGGRGN